MIPHRVYSSRSRDPVYGMYKSAMHSYYLAPGLFGATSAYAVLEHPKQRVGLGLCVGELRAAAPMCLPW